MSLLIPDVNVAFNGIIAVKGIKAKHFDGCVIGCLLFFLTEFVGSTLLYEKKSRILLQQKHTHTRFN